MAKKEKHESHFIPSPFPVVTSYENAFIKKFNDNLAGAVAEVLKYIAHATALSVKEVETKKAFDDDIEKAHQVGDIHKNGRWVWTEYSPGKFDWRTIKKSAPKKIELWKERKEFAKSKTPADCIKILLSKGVVRNGSNISRCDIQTARKVSSVLLNAKEQFNMQPIEVKMRKLKGATAQATAGRLLELNSDYFRSFDSDKYYQDCVVEWHKSQEYNYKRLVDKKKQLQKSGDWDAKRGKLLDEKIRLAKEAAEKYRGFTVEYKGTACEDVVIHEIGHILNAQCTAGCSMMPFIERRIKALEKIKGTQTKSYLDNLKKATVVAKQLNQEHYNLWANYIKGSNLISKYCASKRVEGFAEMFVSYVHGDTELPKSVHDYYDKYFKQTKTSFLYG